MENTSKKRGRPPKLVSSNECTVELNIVKRKRGRPRKEKDESAELARKQSEVTENYDEEAEVVRLPVKKRGRGNKPAKSQWKRIVGTLPGDIIPTQRLPQNRVVLQRYSMLRDVMLPGTSIRELSDALYDEILPIWIKANIPRVERDVSVRRIERLIESWKSMNCRKMVAGSVEEIRYTNLLNSLCSLTYLDLEQLKAKLKEDTLLRQSESRDRKKEKRWELDFEFFLNQMKHPQVGVIGRPDRRLEKQRAVQMEKKERSKIFEVRTKTMQHKNEEVCASTSAEFSNEVDCEAPADVEDASIADMTASDPDYIPPRGRKPKRISKVMLELPTKDLLKDASSIAARLKLSSTAVTSLYAKIIVSGGGDLKDFVLSKTSTWRHRIAGEKQAEKKLKIRFKELSSSYPYGILHWDGKQVKFQSGDVEERLVLCLQHVNSETQPQFLGAPQTPDGTGAAQAEAVVRYIDDCGVEDQVIGHVWDTTASNTGCNLGAAILLDQALGRASLWLACRRHASERHILHAKEAILGKTKSPDEPLFKLFKKHFDSLDISSIRVFEWPGDECSPLGPYKFETERALEVKTWAEKCCVDGVFPREDYRELLELLTHLLGGKIFRKGKKNPPKEVQFKMERPGAFHHARFMSKAIYFLKMFMLTPQLLSRALITHFEANQIEIIAKFILLVYGQYFLQTALTCAAPRLDLTFWRNANLYSHVDESISDAVMKSVCRQMFYLVEETVVLSLCDDGLPSTIKKDLIEALLDSDRLQVFPPMKPVFKIDKLLGKNHDEPQLRDFVGPRSWLLFDLLDIDVHWMEFPPEDWMLYPEYVRFHKLANSIICVNDVAERNVQNVCKYAEYSKDSARNDRVVSVVNFHRELHDFSNMTKAELSKL